MKHLVGSIFKRASRKGTPYVDTRYLGKWLLIGGLVGVVAGLGAIVIFSSISWATKLFLEVGAGYTPPSPAGEGATVGSVIARRWMIPVVTTVGGLLSGLIVFTLAPEAEGHGTDAAIAAFHHHEGHIRTRIPLVKLIASAITIGSGGSAGREGPTAQIAAGFGSLLGDILHLSAADRRIAVTAGIGAGIGAIFKAPLGGAILSAEVLYLQGYEVSALFPSFIASIIGYTIFASWSGFTHIFGSELSVNFDDPLSLGFYALLGLLSGVVGIIYVRTFYGARDLFRALRIPNHFKPAIGGLAVGIMGMFLPHILGMGYGWLQMLMDPPVSMGLALIMGLVFAKIVATSLSVGSGGSGGVFAPGLFIGGMLGAALWSALHGVVGHVPANPTPFVVVGMMALFGGVARAPLAVMLMVSEMTGSYAMLAPAMVAVGISYAVVGNNTIYESQVPTPADSPAHQFEYSLPLLAQLKVRQAMRTDIVPVPPNSTVEEVMKRLRSDHVKSLPVVDPETGRVEGIASREDILRQPQASLNGASVETVMTRNPATVSPEDSLATGLQRLAEYDVWGLPVVEQSGGGNRLVGLLTRQDVVRAHGEAAKRLVTRTYTGRLTAENPSSVENGR